MRNPTELGDFEFEIRYNGIFPQGGPLFCVRQVFVLFFLHTFTPDAFSAEPLFSRIVRHGSMRTCLTQFARLLENLLLMRAHDDPVFVLHVRDHFLLLLLTGGNLGVVPGVRVPTITHASVVRFYLPATLYQYCSPT